MLTFPGWCRERGLSSDEAEAQNEGASLVYFVRQTIISAKIETEADGCPPLCTLGIEHARFTIDYQSC